MIDDEFLCEFFFSYLLSWLVGGVRVREFPARAGARRGETQGSLCVCMEEGLKY